MKAAIYTRVSTEEQSKEGVSLAHQAEKCQLQALLGDMEVVKVIEDAGKSAKTLNRPGIQDLLEMVKRKEIQAIVIFKLDRLTRNVSDLNRLIETFTKQGVSLVSIKDSLDTQSAAGRMVINLLGTISQWEREVIAERTSEALQFKKGGLKKYTRITPYGYRLEGETYVQDEVEQAVLAKIAYLRETMGHSFRDVADKLTLEGVPTRQGKPWAKQTVQRLYER